MQQSEIDVSREGCSENGESTAIKKSSKINQPHTLRQPNNMHMTTEGLFGLHSTKILNLGLSCGVGKFLVVAF